MQAQDRRRLSGALRRIATNADPSAEGDPKHRLGCTVQAHQFRDRFLQLLCAERYFNLQKPRPAFESFEVLCPTKRPAVGNSDGFKETIAILERAVEYRDACLGLRNELSVEKDDHGVSVLVAGYASLDAGCSILVAMAGLARGVTVE